MNSRKGVGTGSSARLREFTEEMDERLLNARIKENRIKNMVDGIWITQTYSNIVNNLHQLGYVGVMKNNVKIRKNVLKEKWNKVHDLFSSLSQFAWNAISLRFEVNDKVWVNLIKVNKSD